MRKVMPCAALVAVLMSLAGCSPDLLALPSPDTSADFMKPDFSSLVYRASDQLAQQVQGRTFLDKDIVVATMVNISDLQQSSTFGREVSSLVASRFTQLGYTVRDLNYTRAMQVVPGTGELALSRDAKKLLHSMKAQAVIAGTFAELNGQTYINLRLINADSGLVIASADVVVRDVFLDSYGESLDPYKKQAAY